MNKRLWLNIIDISVHLAVAVTGSLIIYARSLNPWYALFFFAGGVLIDLDHLVDHFAYFGSKFRLIDFFSSASLSSGKVYIPLHSWELAFALLAVGALASMPGLSILAAGALAHLVMDSFMRGKPAVYFLSYRIKHGFCSSSWSNPNENTR